MTESQCYFCHRFLFSFIGTNPQGTMNLSVIQPGISSTVQCFLENGADRSHDRIFLSLGSGGISELCQTISRVGFCRNPGRVQTLAYLAKVVSHFKSSGFLKKIPGAMWILWGIYSLTAYMLG